MAPLAVLLEKLTLSRWFYPHRFFGSVPVMVNHPSSSRKPLALLALVLVHGALACPSGDEGSKRSLPPPQYEEDSSVAMIGAKPQAKSSGDAELERIEQAFLEGWLSRQPVHATEAGDHRFDGTWPDVSQAGDVAYKSFLLETKAKLAAIAAADLTVENAIDLGILSNQIEIGLFTLEKLRPAEQDPLFYTAMIGDGLDPLATREFAPIEVRARSLASRLEGVAAIVTVAKQRLENPPEIHTKTAITQNRGLIELCKHDLAAMIDKAGPEKPALAQAAQHAAAALESFQTYLESDLVKRSHGDFRLGKERFERKLRLVLDDPGIDPEAVVKDARALLDATRHEMVATAEELWPELGKGKPWRAPATVDEERKLIRDVLARLAEDRSTNATIVSDAQATLRDATQFVKQHDLVRLPEEPCTIIEMPEYRRGVAIAYCDSSGPLEDKPQTFYAIAPTPKDWPAKRVDSFYREYNKAMLMDLTVHEAMPGHFLQAMHNNRFASKLRAVFSHGAFVEGWAVYCEWLMAKHGFGGPRVRMQRQKMALRTAANAILDSRVHAGSMTEKEALALLQDEAFQEEGEAVGKWRRARLTSAQLTTYFYGFSEMMRLRKAAEQQAGFSERAYHDELIAHGSPPPRYLRKLFDPAKAR